ncbi:ArsR/SmtB family transcription factor [Virgibacillus flavescens]|uniref:ArsR/SmtB family transcription factor n=1 Tax=Virgibacillus flavescens TaxID=1611422 RepID=UPI003D34B891
MDVLNMTSKKRETYQIKLEHSLLWECALGIAAVTNKRLLDTLEKKDDYWNDIKQRLSDEMLNHLAYVEKNNTWKALLQFLHQEAFKDLNELSGYIEERGEIQLRHICFPYVGSCYEAVRESASTGSNAAVEKLKEITKDNPFYPAYIDYISTVDPEVLKKHLCFVMKGWYEAGIKPQEGAFAAILERDSNAKKEMEKKLSPEALVEWATGGSTYYPEPGVYHVLLIPQYVYRPWNVETDIEGTKVFYYPVVNESIHPGDDYQPNQFLVNRHKALGDEVRLKIVKYLSENDSSLQDLTRKLNLGKSTVHHHLKILRSAKLVEIIESKYRLKENTLKALGEELEHYMYGK